MSESFFPDELEITLLEAPNFQYISFIDKNAYQKVEVLKKKDLVDGDPQREMCWHRYSYADAIDGPFEIMFDIPFGFAAVSGDAL